MKCSAQKNNKFQVEGIVALVTLASLIFALMVGLSRDAVDIAPFIDSLVPGATDYKEIESDKYAVYGDSVQSPIGYIVVKKHNGFGGPLKVALSVDREGSVLDFAVVEHRETPRWFERVKVSSLFEDLRVKKYTDAFKLGGDLDGVSGATYTTRAITESIKTGIKDVAFNDLGFDKVAADSKRVQFGIPEVVLGALLLFAGFGLRRIPAHRKKQVRWLCMITGLTVFGFWVNHPLTLVDINKFVLGYWPDLYFQLYWYLLIFGLLLIFFTTGKNVYCQFLCPFGAAQELAGLLGKAKNFNDPQYANFFKWSRRVVVWFAVFIALIYRNPGISSYEIYSTLFSLSGTNLEAIFLTIVLAFALFVHRPWCRLLCPVPAFEDFVRFIQRHIKKRITGVFGLKAS